MTDDEPWVYHRKNQTKAYNIRWVEGGESPRTVTKWDQFDPKSIIVVFIKITCVVINEVIDKGKTIDNTYYVERCLKPLVKEISRQRPSQVPKT